MMTSNPPMTPTPPPAPVDWRDVVVKAESRRFVFDYLNHERADMPGDDHPGAQYTNPQVRVWDGPEAMTGNVVAEAYLNEEQPGLIVSAWAKDREANQQLTDGIALWASQKGLEF